MTARATLVQRVPPVWTDRSTTHVSVRQTLPVAIVKVWQSQCFLRNKTRRKLSVNFISDKYSIYCILDLCIFTTHNTVQQLILHEVYFSFLFTLEAELLWKLNYSRNCQFCSWLSKCNITVSHCGGALVATPTAQSLVLPDFPDYPLNCLWNITGSETGSRINITLHDEDPTAHSSSPNCGRQYVRYYTGTCAFVRYLDAISGCDPENHGQRNFTVILVP